MIASRISKAVLLPPLGLACSVASAKFDTDAASKAARFCHAASTNVVLTNTNAVDDRSFRLAVLLGAEKSETFSCLDDWSIKHLKTHAQWVNALPPKTLSKAEVEQLADDAANSLAAAAEQNGRTK